MKNFILFALFAFLFVGFVVALGEAEGKSPPGTENETQAVSIQAPASLASVETISPVNVGQLYAKITKIHKTEAAVVRRHDRRLWFIYAKEVKSLYGYACLEYETIGAIANARSTANRPVFKTEYG